MRAASRTRRSISLLRHLPEPQAERDVVVDGQVRVERVALEDHRDVAVARRDVVDDALADPDDALADLLEAGDHAKRGRLAAARRADEDHELAVVDLEVQTAHRSRSVRVHLRHVLERDLGHREAVPAGAGLETPLYALTWSARTWSIVSASAAGLSGR